MNRYRSILSALCAAGLLTTVGCTFAMSRQLEQKWKGRRAPDFALLSMDGEEVTLRGLRGRPVVLSFFGST